MFENMKYKFLIAMNASFLPLTTCTEMYMACCCCIQWPFKSTIHHFHRHLAYAFRDETEI